RGNIELHKVPIQELQSKLVEQGQIISFESNPNGFFQKGNTVVVDDDMSRFVEKQGPWEGSENPLVGRHGITFLSADPNESADITYRPYLPKSGNYKVYGWWPKLKKAAENIPLKINSNGKIKSVSINQRKTGDSWVYLGTFNFEAGKKTEITLSNNNLNGSLVADAFKFEHQN